MKKVTARQNENQVLVLGPTLASEQMLEVGPAKRHEKDVLESNSDSDIVEAEEAVDYNAHTLHSDLPREEVRE